MELDWKPIAESSDDGKWCAVWEHNGRKCAVTMHPKMLHYCGYVLCEWDSPLNGMTYINPLVESAPVHGGVTFAGKGEFCGEDGWWIGFDCAHVGDIPNIAEGIERFGDSPEYHTQYFEMQSANADMLGMWSHAWTIEEVVMETESLCDWATEFEDKLSELLR